MDYFTSCALNSMLIKLILFYTLAFSVNNTVKYDSLAENHSEGRFPK